MGIASIVMVNFLLPSPAVNGDKYNFPSFPAVNGDFPSFPAVNGDIDFLPGLPCCC